MGSIQRGQKLFQRSFNALAESLTVSLLLTGSLGELDGGEENALDNLSLSGEEGGASDPEGDGSSPPPFTTLYNEGARRKR